MTATQSCKPAADYRTGTPRADGWTAERQAMFLQALAQTGLVSFACEVTEMSATSAYALRRQTRGMAFALAWKAATLLARDTIEDRLTEAAIEGVATLTERLGDATRRQALNPRLSMAVLNRLDARANALDSIEAGVARSIGAAYDDFIWEVVAAGGGADAIAAFLAAHPDPLAAQVAKASAAEPVPEPQLVEESAIFGKVAAAPRPVAAPTTATEPCACPADREAALLQPV